MTGECVCGAVSVTIGAKPEFIHDCNCALCRKSGAAWGYFPTAMVATNGKTVAFVRRDLEDPAVEVHSCPICGATTHWVTSQSFQARNPSLDRMGVNMRLFDPADLEGIEVRFPNGADWSGDGPFDYRRQAQTIGDDWRW